MDEFDVGQGRRSVCFSSKKDFEFFYVVGCPEIDIKCQGLLIGWNFEADFDHFTSIQKFFNL